ncbi:MAG TPA: DNA repair protein RecN [Gemmatimonadaceae bacterium]|nr:DNA repair protein RecN [Gemmatimonadaceae bacterium]
MLTELRIRNFAIIDSLTLPLEPGFNVLTGETGAGKSIVVGALALLLGERASADLVRTGADKATVEGVFDTGASAPVQALLDAHGIDADDGLVVLRREISVAGRARAWINDAATTAAVLAEVGRTVVNLHGQHEAQSLLDADSQRDLLDAFAGAAAAAATVRERYEAMHALASEIDALKRRAGDAERRADYLEHVAREIEEARLQPGEAESLDEEARRLEHADELRTLAQGMADALQHSDGGVLPDLGQVQRSLGTIQRIDPSLARLQELFDNGYYALEELGRALEDYAAGVDLDPARLADVERRRDIVFRLTKKYGPSVADVLEAGRNARAQLDLVDTAALDIRQLEQRYAGARDVFTAAASELTVRRRDGARRLSAEVDALLPELGLPDGKFSARLVTRATPAATGAEDVEFLVALNVGHDARPLARVASGGELSRIMLALKTILARVDHVPTLVFDEVDAGIGGRVGLQVGDTMRRVAAHHQVLAITHLAQIAARAHHHVVVSKGARGGITTTDTRVVHDDERVHEIARMLGGDQDSETGLAHARELLANAAAPSVAAAAPLARAARKRNQGSSRGR